jgi:hypothetical protein
MRHYHHTDGGMSHQEKARFLAGRHGLVSYVYQAPTALAFEVCTGVVLDNGAYTVWQQGGTLDVDGYLAWCYQWHRHPAFDWALIPDVIEGTEEENDTLLAEWHANIRGVPVWHMHESLDRLLRLASEWDTVALGSSGAWPNPGKGDWWRRMGEAMDAVCDREGRPPCRLHGLRMLDPAIFTRLPLASADSMNAVRRSNDVARFGSYVPPLPCQRSETVARIVEAHTSAPCWRRVDQQNLFEAA